MNEKKQYVWMPSNCEVFYETYDSIEGAVAEAQRQWDKKDELYEEEDENNVDVNLYTVREYDPSGYIKGLGEELIDMLQGDLNDFTYGCDTEPEVVCKDIPAFCKAVHEALMPLVREHLTFEWAQVGDALALTYNVATRKYTFHDKEYDQLPAPFAGKAE